MTVFLPRATRKLLLVALGLSLTTLLPACGKKGPVRPRLASLPAAPAELVILQQGESFLLSWPIPELNQDGSAAEDLSRFRIYRMIYAAADGCPTCRDPEELVADIDPLYPAPAIRTGKRLHWRDEAVAPGTGHAYLVVPATAGRHEGGAVAGHRTYVAPPPPPAGLKAEATDRQVRLSWNASTELPAGQELLGYNLYRRGQQDGYPPLPLNARPLIDSRLTDLIAEGGKTVAYRVSSVVRTGEAEVESAPSAEIIINPAEMR